MSPDPQEQANRSLAEAIRLAELGYALTPVTITRKANGKKAVRFHRGWRHESSWSADPQQIRAWWVDYPDTSFALGGGANGIEGVDLDVKPAEMVDAVTWWSEQSLPVASFIQHTPSGGMHLIWRVRDDGRTLPQEAGKTFGRGVDTRNRAGLFFATGAYVVGEDGHYEAPTVPPLAVLEQTPAEVVALFADAGRPPADRPSDGRIVHHDEEWQAEQVQRALDQVREHRRDDGGYRAKLQHLGLFFGRIVEQGLCSAEHAEEKWLEAHQSVWGSAVWPENLKDFRDALADGPKLERWRFPDPSGAASSADGSDDGAAYDLNDPEVYARALAAEVRKARLRRDAKHVLESEARAHRPSIRSGLIDSNELDSIEPPRMLMGELIPQASMGFLGGDTGTYKSFVAISWACSLASGTAWQGKPEFRVQEPTRALYVAAEGSAGVAQRIESWKLENGALPRGRLVLYPRPIDLTSRLEVAELAEIVEAEGFEFVVIDTLHRSMPGTEDNSATEFGLVFEAMARLRDDYGATVLFIDHSGHDGSRIRGTAAKGQDADFVIMAERAGDNVPESQRTIRVHKRKDLVTTGTWPIRLVPAGKSAVVELGTVVTTGGTPFGTAGQWWDMDEAEVPEIVASISSLVGPDGKQTKHSVTSAARDAFRVLRFMDYPDGVTVTQLMRMANEGPRTHARTPFYAAVAILVDLGIVDKVDRSRLALADPIPSTVDTRIVS